MKEAAKRAVRAAAQQFLRNVKMSKYIWLFDAGHGGMIDGEYQTSTRWWKRSYFKDGKLLDPAKHTLVELEAINDMKYYEGVGNRDIAKRIMELCKQNGIRYYDVVNSEKDVSLANRVRTANDLQTKYGNCLYLSIHSDAFEKQSAEGFSVYTSPGFTDSDKIAPIIFKEMGIEFPTHKPRPDKEAAFYVLKNTSMPAVLSENLFYTNYKECLLLNTEAGRQKIANAHFRAIQHIEKYGI